MTSRPSQLVVPPVLGPFDLTGTPVLQADVLVIGGGVAGCAAALAAAQQGAAVLLLNKTVFTETNTAYAQGGLAVAQSDSDSPELHLKDTLSVGAGLCDAKSSHRILEGAPEVLAWLRDLGARFDTSADGSLRLSREGGHTVGRVVHANGDATGAEIQTTLTRSVIADPRITVKEHAFVRDLVVDEDGRCVGAVGWMDGSFMALDAGAVIVATGGCGQIYRETTNPIGATGDGIALCFRAGARMADLEFIQFHPTTLYIAGAARFLITEACRGAGGVLRDKEGVAFMQGMHPMADLAPRDVVSRSILERMVATNDTHVYLDLSGLDGDPRTRFPTIARMCAAFDIDIASDPIPVRPGAHYVIGGAWTDDAGRTSVPGLFAAGEAAATGLHGANRLASNSLLEGAVMGRATGAVAGEATVGTRSRGLPRRVPGPEPVENAPRILGDDLLYSLKSLMWRNVGLMRDADGLGQARERIAFWHHYLLKAARSDHRTAELCNMLQVSALVTEAAILREESRGVHFRRDYRERVDHAWCRRVFLGRAPDGTIRTETGPLLQPTDSETPAVGET